MAVPKSVVKLRTKSGQCTVEFTDSVDKTVYYMNELINAALRDTGKYITKVAKTLIRKRTGRLAKNIQYWNRKKDQNLQVGIKPGGWYGMYQEFGSEHIPRVGAIEHSAKDNIDTIRKIQAQYLSALNSEAAASAKIGGDNEE